MPTFSFSYILMVPKFKKNKKRSLDSVTFPVFLGILLLVVIGLLLISNWKIGSRRSELDSQQQYLGAQLKALQEKKDQLQQQVSEASQTDYLETEARERFNLKKPGEQAVTIIPPDSSEPKTQNQKEWWNPFTW